MQILSYLMPNLPEIVQRKEIGRLTGGVINPRTMANLDCLGLGPKGRFIVARKICYPRESFLTWLEARVKSPQVKQ